MASLQLYRRRIKSINSTRQITKAMELVASSKMRKAQDQTLRLREYASITDEFVRLLSSSVDPKSHPLLANPKVEPGLTRKLIVVVTSDRGLAGAYNAGLLRKLVELESEKQHGAIEYVTIGKKGQDFLTRIGKPIVATFTKFAPHPSIQDIAPIVKIASDGFLNKEYQSIHIAYTEFISTIKQVPQIIQLLPLTAQAVEPLAKPSEYRFEPSRDQVLEFILPRALEMVIYRAILESIAAEHSSRMIAMKSASDNAKELVDDLTLSYNSVRQAKITQELAEIAIGAEAIT
ncbi:ATP synthase F1 subunit gamma [Candidatus Berkelbacteria bacterium]|nr:ATP synthase F1 subunit gamma [Candidatus Berkelbacteria bacterium]